MSMSIDHMRNSEPLKSPASLTEARETAAQILSLVYQNLQQYTSIAVPFFNNLLVTRDLQDLTQKLSINSITEKISRYEFKMAGQTHLLAFAFAWYSSYIPVLRRMSPFFGVGLGYSIWYLYRRIDRNNAISAQENRQFLQSNEEAKIQTFKDQQAVEKLSEQIAADLERKKMLKRYLISKLKSRSRPCLLLSTIEKIQLKKPASKAASKPIFSKQLDLKRKCAVTISKEV